ncbi:hypothetical protein [Haloarcula litorea]|uniref:hypothetical protein n=1 Tax=Haloarcula litorea TaxID=3032579 RepID=UPI0023E85FEF|nr:hypothetical protein [Halomicroarcula sp. GDY20]
MSDRKALLLLAAALLLTTSASAADVKVAGLTEENVNTTFVSDSAIRFETSYLNKTLTPRQIFVPNATDHAVVDWSFTRESWGESSGVSTLNYQYGLAYNYEYPSPEASALLGQNSSTGTGLPANYFQYSDSFYSNESTARGTVFSSSFADDKARWNITVNAHYEHLIINYDLIYNGTIQDSYQDIYSGDDPELIPVDGQINKYDGLNTPSDDYIDRFLMQYDRKYEYNPHNVTIVLAHPKDEELLSVDLGRNTEELNDNHYSEVVDTAQEVNKTATLLNDTSNYSIKAYNTTIPGNTTTTLQYKIDSLENETNDLRMWILGSFAGGSGTSSDPYEIETCQQLENIDANKTATYELVSDIDCTGSDTWDNGKGFDPILATKYDSGWNDTWNGVLDGNQHIIEGIYVDRPDNAGAGLFSVVKDAIITEVAIINANITGSQHIGILAGAEGGGTYSETKINEVFTGGSVRSVSSSSTQYGQKWAGGIIGQWGGGTLNDSYTDASVTGGKNVGGTV